MAEQTNRSQGVNCLVNHGNNPCNCSIILMGEIKWPKAAREEIDSLNKQLEDYKSMSCMTEIRRLEAIVEKYEKALKLKLGALQYDIWIIQGHLDRGQYLGGQRELHEKAFREMVDAHKACKEALGGE